MINSIHKISIGCEGGKWHLQIYVLGVYDYEEQYSEYCDTLEECYENIRQFQKNVIPTN